MRKFMRTLAITITMKTLNMTTILKIMNNLNINTEQEQHGAQAACATFTTADLDRTNEGAQDNCQYSRVSLPLVFSALSSINVYFCLL